MPADARRGETPGAELTAAGMEGWIRAYFEACNSGDVERIASYFEPAAVHFFPPGMYGGPFRGAETIARKWRDAVTQFGSVWTVDHVLCDPPTRRAVIEWSHFKRRQNVLLRGDEWYLFSPGGLILEIRAYYASPQDPALRRLELGGFDYAGRGYTMTEVET
jgi:SnoaL-like domain